jgi:Rrf2 family iron-sulfur cluster assembly transcriptional regulator
MLDLSAQKEEKPVSLADISRRQEISLSYLEQLFVKLRKNGLVRSIKGPGGGYLLARSADEVTVADIVDSVDENVDVTRCSGKGNCQRGAVCLTHELWSEFSDEIRNYLSGINLENLKGREHVKRVLNRQEGKQEAEVFF